MWAKKTGSVTGDLANRGYVQSWNGRGQVPQQHLTAKYNKVILIIL